MPRVLIAMDSFKGSLTAGTACRAFAEGLRRVSPALTADCCPLADGGEGTGDVLGGEIVPVRVVDTYGRPADARWIRHGRVAVVEASAGSPYLSPERRPGPANVSTSRGTGLLVRSALADPAVDEVWVALGGTGTVDGGIGFLDALGAHFYDYQDHPLDAVMGNWHKVERVTLPHLAKRVVGLADVWVPLLGVDGALARFGPQKGLSSADARRLGPSLARFSERINSRAAAAPGAGAAGGIGFALAALGAELVSGARWIAQAVGLSDRVQQADWVVTGEGCLDEQSLLGKVVSEVLAVARRNGRPVWAVAGTVPLNLNRFYEAGLTAAESLVSGPMDVKDAQNATERFLEAAGERFGRMLAAERGILC